MGEERPQCFHPGKAAQSGLKYQYYVSLRRNYLTPTHADWKPWQLNALVNQMQKSIFNDYLLSN